VEHAVEVGDRPGERGGVEVAVAQAAGAENAEDEAVALVEVEPGPLGLTLAQRADVGGALLVLVELLERGEGLVEDEPGARLGPQRFRGSGKVRSVLDEARTSRSYGATYPSKSAPAPRRRPGAWPKDRRYP
jgi:hypothetical protein